MATKKTAKKPLKVREISKREAATVKGGNVFSNAADTVKSIGEALATVARKG